MKLLNGIEDQLSKQGYRLLFCKTDNKKEIEAKTIQEVLQLGVSGIIIYPVEGEIYSEELLRLTVNQFPYVVVDRYLRGLESNYVCADNFQGAFDATECLISLGHRQIGFLSTHFKGTSSIEDRLAGYENALAQHNIPVEHRLRKTGLNMEQVNSVIQRPGRNTKQK